MTEDSQESAVNVPEINETETVPQSTESETETEAQPVDDVNVDTESKQESDNASAQSEVDAKVIKDNDAWARQRKEKMRYKKQSEDHKNEAEQAKHELAELRRAQSAQSQQPVNNMQSAESGAVLRDPKTGREIPLYQSYDELISAQAGAPQQSPGMQQQYPQQPQNYNHNQPVQQPVQQQVPAQTGNQISPFAEEQLKTTYNKLGETEVRNKLQGLVSLGGLDASMINAAAITGHETGENGISLLYELAKDRKGQQILCEIADRPDSQSKTVALSNLLYSRVAEKNRRMKSNATKQAVSLPQQGNLQTTLLSPEESFRRDQEMCLKSQGHK